MNNGRRERDVMYGPAAAMPNPSCVSAASGIPVSAVLPRLPRLPLLPLLPLHPCYKNSPDALCLKHVHLSWQKNKHLKL